VARYHHLFQPHWLQLMPSLPAIHTHATWQAARPGGRLPDSACSPCQSGRPAVECP
jgi:hypothetical protein